MITNVYLHPDIVTILRMIDKDLSIAVNKVLDIMYISGMSFTDYEECRTRDNTCKRYCITIDNSEYIATAREYPVNSPKCSLRRILYWFIENEIYYETELEFNNTNGKSQLPTFSKYCLNADDIMVKALNFARKHNLSDILILGINSCRTELSKLLKEVVNEQRNS